MKEFLLVMGLALAAVAPPVLAVDEAALGIKVRSQSGMKYITGGIGEQADDFAEVSGRYPVHLRIKVGGADVDRPGARVRVIDTRGESQVEADAAGPLFYVTPPSGRWTFEVRWGDQVLSETRDLTGRRYLDLVFDFKPAP